MPSWPKLTKPARQLNRTPIFTHTLTLLFGVFVGYETHRSIGLAVLLAKLTLLGGAGYGAIWIWAQTSSCVDKLRGSWSSSRTLSPEVSDEEV